MLIQLIISLFGIAFVHRNLSLLEKAELISRSDFYLFFYFLQLPFYFYLFFKELFVFVLIYIGIFLITLIVFDKIIAYFREKTFENLHLNVIERIILQLRAGKSAQTSLKNIFCDLTTWQKSLFFELNEICDLKTSEIYKKDKLFDFHSFYFEELKMILCSTGNVIEQLKSLQLGLRLQKELRHRSRQALQQTKAQAMVSFFIYSVFVAISITYLNLEVLSLTMLASLSLFGVGQFLIFKLGGTIKWKT